MCFNKGWSITFAITSFSIVAWVLSGQGIWKPLAKWQRHRIAALFIYFALMECLQFLQYLVIGQCDNMVNKFLTFLAWLHICWQGYFCNIGFSALDPHNQNKERENVWGFVFKLANVSAILLALRGVIPLFIGLNESSSYLRPCRGDDESVCGPRTCTEMGYYHLKWMFILVKPSYALPCAAVHFIFMFIAPLLMGLHFSTVVLFLTSQLIDIIFSKAHPGEIASIWCVFSVSEAAIAIATQYIAVSKAAKKLKTH